MSKLVFKPGDFHEFSRIHGGRFQTMGEYEAMATLANECFEKWLSEQKTVYQEDGYEYWGPGPTVGPKPMQARLVCIEEASKPEPKFKPGDIVTPVEILYCVEGIVSPGVKGIVAEATHYSVRVQFVGIFGAWSPSAFKRVV